jgi:hypothetical protein
VTTFVAPPLGGIHHEVDEKWFVKYTRNSQKMIDSGDRKANCSWNQWKPSVMTDFEHLSNAEIRSIYYYLKKESEQRNLVYYADYLSPGCNSTWALANATLEEIIDNAAQGIMETYYGYVEQERYIALLLGLIPTRLDLKITSEYDMLRVYLFSFGDRSIYRIDNDFFSDDKPFYLQVPARSDSYLVILAVKGTECYMAEPLKLEADKPIEKLVSLSQKSKTKIERKLKKLIK